MENNFKLNLSDKDAKDHVDCYDIDSRLSQPKSVSFDISKHVLAKPELRNSRAIVDVPIVPTPDEAMRTRSIPYHTKSVRTQRITALMSKYTNNYIKDSIALFGEAKGLLLPFCLQNINFAEFGGVTVGKSGSGVAVQSNLFFTTGTGSEKIPIYSPFTRIHPETSELEFVKDIVPSAGDTGLVELEYDPERPWHTNISGESSNIARVFASFEDNYDYWLNYRNRAKVYSGLRKTAPGSVVYDVFLLVTFATTMLGHEYQYSFYEDDAELGYPILSASVTSMLAHMLTALFGRVSKDSDYLKGQGYFEMNVDDLVALIIAFYATQTFSGVSAGNYFDSDDVNADRRLTVVGEDPEIEVNGITIIIDPSFMDYKKKYQRIANAHVKIKAYMDVVNLAGENYAVLMSPQPGVAGAYAKYDTETLTFSAYIEDVIDFSDAKPVLDDQGHVTHYVKTVTVDEGAKPITLIVDGLVCASIVQLDEIDVMDFNPNRYKYTQICSLVSNYYMDTSEVTLGGYSFTGSTTCAKQGGTFTWTKKVSGSDQRVARATRYGISSYSGSPSDDEYLDGWSRGIVTLSNGFRVYQYHSVTDDLLDSANFLTYADKSFHVGQCFDFDLDGILVSSLQATNVELGIESRGNALNDTSFVEVVIATLDPSTISPNNYQSGAILARAPLSVLKSNYDFKEWIKNNWPRQNGGQLFDHAYLGVLYHTSYVHNVEILEWDLAYEDLNYIGSGEPGPKAWERDPACCIGKTNTYVKSYFPDPAGDGGGWWVNWFGPARTASSHSARDGSYIHFTDGWYMAVPGDNWHSATLVRVEDPNNYVSDTSTPYCRVTSLKITLERAALDPILMPTQADVLFSREYNMFIGDIDHPLCQATGYFDIVGDPEDLAYPCNMADNHLISVLNEAGLRFINQLTDLDALQVSDLLIDIQDPASGMGCDIDMTLMRQIIKQSKEQRSVQTMRNYLSIFDALEVEVDYEDDEDAVQLEDKYLHAIGSIPIQIDPVVAHEDTSGELQAYQDPKTGDWFVPFRAAFADVKIPELHLDLSKYSTEVVTAFDGLAVPDIMSRYNALVDLRSDLVARGSDLTPFQIEQLIFASDAIQNVKEQLANEYSSLNASATVMALEDALDCVEDEIANDAEMTVESLQLSIDSITSGVLSSVTVVETEVVNTSERLNAAQQEMALLVNNSTTRVKQEAEAVKRKAVAFYNQKLKDIKDGVEQSQSPFSIESLKDMLVNHVDGLKGFLSAATGIGSTNNSYLGWQDSSLFTPTSTVSAVMGITSKGLSAALSGAYNVFSRVVSGSAEKVRKFMTSTFKDGVSYHLRDSGFATLGLQASTFIIDKAEAARPQSEFYWLYTRLAKLDGTNSCYYASQIGPLLIIVQDYSSEQIMVTVNPILEHTDTLKEKNDYNLLDAEADCIIRSIASYNAMAFRLQAMGLIPASGFVPLRVPNKTDLLKDIISKAKGKSAAAATGLKALILGVGVAAGVALCATGLGSVAGVALIAGATAVGMSCVGPSVDQSKIERLQEDATYSNGLIMAADLASVWTNSIPRSVPKQLAAILSRLSNVRLVYGSDKTDPGSLVHCGDGLTIDTQAVSQRNIVYNDTAITPLGYIPLLSMSGAPNFQVTLVTDRERYIKQSLAILATAVVVGGLAFAATKSTISKAKRKKVAKLQRESWQNAPPSKANYNVQRKNASGEPMFNDDGTPILDFDEVSFNRDAKAYQKWQRKTDKKISKLTGCTTANGGTPTADLVTPMINTISTGDPSVAKDDIPNLILKRIG